MDGWIRSFPIGARGIWNTKVGSYGFRNFGSQSTIASTSMSGKTQGPKKKRSLQTAGSKKCKHVVKRHSCHLRHAFFFINRHLETSCLCDLSSVFFYLFPQIALAIGVLTSSIGILLFFFCGNCLKIDGLVLRLTDIQVDCFDRCLVMDFQVAK